MGKMSQIANGTLKLTEEDEKEKGATKTTSASNGLSLSDIASGKAKITSAVSQNASTKPKTSSTTSKTTNTTTTRTGQTVNGVELPERFKTITDRNAEDYAQWVYGQMVENNWTDEQLAAALGSSKKNATPQTSAKAETQQPRRATPEGGRPLETIQSELEAAKTELNNARVAARGSTYRPRGNNEAHNAARGTVSDARNKVKALEKELEDTYGFKGTTLENMLSSQAEKTKSNLSAIGGLLLDVGGVVDQSASSDTRRVENARQNIETYTKNRDAAATQEERDRWQKLIDHAQNEIKAYTRSSEIKQQPMQDATQKLYEASNEQAKKAEQYREGALDGKSDIEQAAVNVGMFLGDVGSKVGMNAILPGAGTFAFGVDAAGQSVREYRQTKGNAQGYAADQQIGQYGLGNIDLYNRPIYHNEDGSISTVESITIEENGQYILLPTVAYDDKGNAKKLTDKQAVDRYHKTGEMLGAFTSEAAAEQYAEQLHLAQEFRYASEYNPMKALARGALSAAGVAAGAKMSTAANNAALKFLRSKGIQNLVAPNIGVGGLSGLGFATGTTALNELGKAVTDTNYTPDWKQIGATELSGFVFGALSRLVSIAAVSGQNKAAMRSELDELQRRYEYAKSVIDNPGVAAADKARGAQSVMDAVDGMSARLDELYVVGAQKEVDAARAFLSEMKAEMQPYTTASGTAGVGAGAQAMVPFGGGSTLKTEAPAQATGQNGTINALPAPKAEQSEAPRIVAPTAEQEGLMLPTASERMQAKPDGFDAQTGDQTMNGGTENGGQQNYLADGGQRSGIADSAAAADAVPDGIGGRLADERTAGQAGSVGQGGPQRAAEQSRTILERQAAGRNLRKVSTRELGIDIGTENAAVAVMPEQMWDDEMRSLAQEVRQETGKNVTYVLGRMQVTKSDGSVAHPRGAWTADGIIIQADNFGASVTQIGRHEMFHDYVEQDPGVLRAVENAIREQYTDGELDKVLDSYISRLRGIIDVDESMTQDEVDAAYDNLKNEVFADAYAEINAFGAHADKFNDTVRETVQQRGFALPRENAAATDRRTGPPADGRFSIDKTREKTIKDQLKDYRAGRMSRYDEFYYGTTPRALGEAGLDELPLVLSQSDYKKSTSQKHSVPNRATTRLAELVGDPILAWENGDEVGILTKDIDANGKPLLVGIRKNVTLDNEPVNRIKSAYGLDNPQAWMNNQRRNGGTLHVFDKSRAASYLNDADDVIGRTGTNRSAERIAEDEPEVKSGIFDDVPRAELPTAAEAPDNSAGNMPEVKEKFSLDEPVEATPDLLAIHNMSEKNLRDALELGGLPMPSIAVVKAATGHSKFGPISLIFGADTIDPQITKRNKVYGGDAYTPTAPSLGFKLDSKTIKRMQNRVHDILGDEERMVPLSLDEDNLSERIHKEGGDFKAAYRKNDALQYAFLKEAGVVDHIPTKEKKWSSKASNYQLKKLVEEFDIRRLREMGFEETMNREPEIRELLLRSMVEEKGGGEMIEKAARALYDKPMSFAMLNSIIHDAARMTSGESGMEADEAELNDMLKNAMTSDRMKERYDDWLDELSEGIIAKKGIRNNKDFYTPSGNRRSFEALYDDYTLENIVKAMRGGEERGSDTFGVNAKTLQSVTTPSYGSVADIKRDSGRLGAVDEKEYEERKAEIDERINEALENVYNTTKHWSDNRFIEYDSIAEAIINAARGARTVSSIMRSMQKDGYSISESVAEELRGIYDDTANMPTEYFEAKPQRAVDFDEVLAAVVPDSMDKGLIERLRNEGLNVVEYAADDDADRLEKVNSVPNARFSVDDELDDAFTEDAEKEMDRRRRESYFYSKLENEVEAFKGQKMGASSVISYLKGRGVKDEEIKWSGIKHYLEGKRSVDKDELLNYLRENRLDIEDKEISDEKNRPHYTEEESAELDRISRETERLIDRAMELWEEAYNEILPDDVVTNESLANGLTREIINRHGGMRYFTGVDSLSPAERELYSDVADRLRRLDYQTDEIASKAKARMVNTSRTHWSQYKLDGGENYRELLFKMPGSDYTNDAMHAHWGGENGVLAHARVQDFKHGGEPVLFIDEIQSDWHNAGQKQGYQEKGQKPSEEEIRKKYADADKVAETVHARDEQLGKLIVKVQEAVNADEMYPWIYNRVRRALMEHEMREGDTAKAYAKLTKDEKMFVTTYKEDSEYVQQLYDEAEAMEYAVPDAPFQKTYHEYVLKDLLRRAAEDGYKWLAWTPGWMQEERWSSDYAEGYRIEYDQDIPKFLKKYGKRWGAQVRDIDLDELANTTVPAIDITDKMRNSILTEGQPRFSIDDEETGERLNTRLPGNDEERVFYAPGGVEVIQNPTAREYEQMREEALAEYPQLRGTGEPLLRRTFDEDGNEYYWRADKAMHARVEPAINRRFNTRTSQQWEWWKKPDKDDYPIRYSIDDGQRIIPQSSAEYARMKRDGDIEEEKRQKPQKPVRESLPVIAKRDLRQNLLNLFSIPAGQRNELGNVIERYADRMLNDGRLTQRDMDDFFDRMYAEGVISVEADDFYQEARSAIAGRRIYVNETTKGDFGDDWNAFRKRAFAAGVYLTNDRADPGVDVVNAELADRMPGAFDDTSADMRNALERVVQLAEEGKDEKMSLAEYTAMLARQEYVSEDEVLDNMERQMDWALRTFAEKAKLEVTLRDRTGTKIAQERERAGESAERERAREAARRAKERDRRKELAQRQRENRELRELQNKTLKQLQWLNKNRYRAPGELKKAWDEVLGDIDIYAASAADETRWSKKYNATWRDIADMYKKAKETDPNFLPSKELDRIVMRLDGDKIEDMDLAALQDLYKAAVGLRTEFYNRNNVINDEEGRMFAEVYADAKRELAEGTKKVRDEFDEEEIKRGRMDAWLNDLQLTPMNTLERMAGWNPNSQWYSMAKQLEEGERAERRFRLEAQNTLADFLTENQEWVKKADGQGKDAIWYELEVPELMELGMGDKPIFGKAVKVYMTPAQKVHMYLESKSYDNLRHMAGGRTFPNRKLYSEGERAEAFAQGKTVRLAPETVKKIVSNLTPEEQALADALDKFYNGYAKENINRVSNALYGYDKALGKNYAPIYTNGNYVKSELGIFDVTAEGVGNLKPRQYSGNPSYNIGAFDAFERSVDRTSRFVGMAIPVRNWNTLMDWREKNGSMRDVVTHEWGKSYADYIDKLLVELQQGKENDAGKMDKAANAILSRYISAVFGFNPSIVFKQFASYPLAAAYLGWENMPVNIPKTQRVDDRLINAYTGELGYRLLGYSTPETAQLKNNPGRLEERGPLNFLFGGGAITWMDGMTVKAMWSWAENKVRREQPELGTGSDEIIATGASPFYQEVARVFEEAVSRSQPMYDVMHRSNVMRESGALTRTFNLFKTVPQQEYNMLRQAVGEARWHKENGSNEEARQEANKKAGRAVLGVLVGNLMLGTITFLNAMLTNKGKKYRNEDGDFDIEKLMQNVGKQYFADSAGLVIGGNVLAEMLGSILAGDKWYDIRVPGGEQLEEILEGVINAGKTMTGLVKDSIDVARSGGNWLQYMKDNRSDYISAVHDATIMLAKYIGRIPAGNVEKYLLGAMSWLWPQGHAAIEDFMEGTGKSSLKGLNGGALETRTGNILKDRAGNVSKDAIEEIARLYDGGYTDAVPADQQKKLTVNSEERELNIAQQQTYKNVWKAAVGNALDEMVGSRDFAAADDETRAKMLKRLYDYATDKAKEALFDDYEAKSSTEKADAAIAGGASLTEAAQMQQSGEIDYYMKWQESDARKEGVASDIYIDFKMTTKDFTADKDEDGKSISGSKKEKVLDYIDGLPLTLAQKDALYYDAGYKESTIDDAPWNDNHRGITLPR